MALLISHRGNTNGINIEKENSPDYIESALKKGYFVMADVFLIGDKHISFGCEAPQYATSVDFLKTNNIIAKANSTECLDFLISNEIHCFYHDYDKCTITSGGLIWTRPGGNITQRCIFNMPEWVMNDITELKDIKCAGICSDKIEIIKTSRIEFIKNESDESK
jgi:hypothetical protein